MGACSRSFKSEGPDLGVCCSRALACCGRRRLFALACCGRAATTFRGCTRTCSMHCVYCSTGNDWQAVQFRQGTQIQPDNADRCNLTIRSFQELYTVEPDGIVQEWVAKHSRWCGTQHPSRQTINTAVDTVKHVRAAGPAHC